MGFSSAAAFRLSRASAADGAVRDVGSSALAEGLDEGKPSREQRLLLEGIVRELPLVELWKNSSLEDFDPKKFGLKR